MTGSEWNRREFHRLTLAAMGGLVTGSLAGCKPTSPEGGSTTGSATPPAADATVAGEESRWMKEPHVCRGLNTCKNLGTTKDNACAGQGACASVASHLCGGQNECKGQGGCGEKPGENSCKGKGYCAVPLPDHAWGTARQNYEAAMKLAGKEFGTAPAKM